MGCYRQRAAAGIENGTPELNPLVAGSGGGGGANAAGAAGGGALRLQAANTVSVAGDIISNGGNSYIGGFS